jgi:hypothetical protein
VPDSFWNFLNKTIKEQSSTSSKPHDTQAPPVVEEEKRFDIYGPEEGMYNKRYPGGYNPLIDSILETVFMEGKGRHPFLQLVREIESDNDKTKVSKEGAKGVYQFLDEDSIDAALERAKQIGVSKDFLKDIHRTDASEWTDQQADVMFIANLFPRGVETGRNTYFKRPGRKGLVDELMYDALINLDRNAMEDLYYTLHHTTNMKKYPGKLRGIPPSTPENVNRRETPTWDFDFPQYYNTFEDIDGKP